jgi:hypothetical protein
MLGMNGFYFGEDGLYETKNEMLIKLLIPLFEVVSEEDIQSVFGVRFAEPVKLTVHEATEAVESVLIEEVIVEPMEEVEAVKPTMKKCSKCDFECENQGAMLAHHKKEHPKNKGGK